MAYAPSESEEVTITVLDLQATEGLLLEAEHLLARAERLSNSFDYNGAIEAAQHAIELATKSLYRLVGLPAPRTHLQAFEKRTGEEAPLEKVAERLHGVPDYLMIWLAKTSWIGTMWAWAHNTSLYGCLDIPASKLFDKNDADIAIQYARTSVINCGAMVGLVKAGQTKIKPPASRE
jgi:hypothetical protein